MRKHEDVLLNSATGLPISGGTVTVRVANASPGTGALASIYSDNGITLIGGSVVTTSAVGRFNFYAPDGRYDLTFAGTGFSSYIVSDLEIADVQTGPVIRADFYSTLSDAVAVAVAAGGGEVILSANASYTVSAAIAVSADGVVIRGAGHTSVINVTNTGDVFNVTAALFELSDCRVSIGTNTTRTGAIVAANSASATQGRISNVRFEGASGSSNNGYIFKTSTPAITSWMFNQLRIVGGRTWTSLVFMSSSTSSSISSTHVTDVHSSAAWSDAAFALDGFIDTFLMENVELEPSLASGPTLHLRNTVAASIPPRWVNASNCHFSDANSSGSNPAVKVDATHGLSIIGGNISSNPDRGIVIGASAQNVVVSGVNFTTIDKEAVTIANGAKNISIIGNHFIDTGKGTDNTYDTISVAANASDFRIIGNDWNLIGFSNKPRYGIAVAAGTSAGWSAIGNDFTPVTFGTGQINDNATGTRAIWGNQPAAVSNRVNNTSTIISNDLLTKRIKNNQASSLVAGDFALSAGWGTTATVTAITGTDQAWQITVTSSGTGQAANPTITLTFKDGTWTSSPICVSKMAGGTGTVTALTEAPTATTNVITFQGTPVAASTYIIASHVIGR